VLVTVRLAVGLAVGLTVAVAVAEAAGGAAVAVGDGMAVAKGVGGHATLPEHPPSINPDSINPARSKTTAARPGMSLLPFKRPSFPSHEAETPEPVEAPRPHLMRDRL
jgi:hypothetical protein